MTLVLCPSRDRKENPIPNCVCVLSSLEQIKVWLTSRALFVIRFCQQGIRHRQHRLRHYLDGPQLRPSVKRSIPCSIDSERLPLRSSQTYTQPEHNAMRSSLPRRWTTMGMIPRRTAWKMISASRAVRTRMLEQVGGIMLRRLGNVERGQRSSRRRVEVQIVYLAPRFGREDGGKSCGKRRAVEAVLND